MLGFACIYIPDSGNRKKYTYTKLTAAAMSKLSPDEAYDKLYFAVIQNLQALQCILYEVSLFPADLRMYRISSDLLPLYTHPVWGKLYEGYLSHVCAVLLERCGTFARRNAVKLSMHPGQFVCLASDRPEVVSSSISELEYHARCALWLGYGRSTYTDFKINVHCSGRLGPDGFRSSLDRLSDAARRLITVENAEVGVGLDEILDAELDRHLPVVLDIHHHWCKTGEFIQPDDCRVRKVIESWSTRPTMHYSCSKEMYLPDTGMPDHTALVQKYKMSALRAHSDTFPNQELNAWALSFYADFDIMCEAKLKNKAQHALRLSLNT